MNAKPGNYFQTLAGETARNWNDFWFRPSDPATLGALRVLVGVLALYLVASYTPDLDRYFGAGGLLPVKLLTEFQQAMGDDVQFVPPQVRECIPRQYRFSYLDYLAGSRLKAAHLAGLAVLMLFTLGVLTRLTAVASLVVFLSYMQRGPMLTSGTEPMLAMLLFYLVIGPSGAAFSFDARRARKRLHTGEERRVPAESASSWATVATRLIQVHFTLVLVMIAVAKLGNEAWWNGLGVWWLLTRSESRLVDLTSLHELPLLINAWTYAVLFCQALLPILIWNRLTRPLMLVLHAVMWLLLAPVIGNLPLAAVMIVASLAFVSPALFRRLFPEPAAATTN